MTWQLGLMFICVFLVAIWAAAEILIDDRKDWKRLRKIEAARADWNARLIESQCFYRKDEP